MQPRRLSRAARKLCRNHAWNARSKQRHVPDTKQVLLWKGWVLKQRCSITRRGNCYPSTRGIPAAHRTFRGLMFIKTSGQLLREHTRNPATWISICTQGTERCSCDKIAALARHNHTWISLRAQRNMFWRKDCCVLTPQAHLDLSPCAKRHVPAKRKLRSHAASTLGSRSVGTETCSIEKTAAISRCPPKIDDFYLRTPDPVSDYSQARARPLHYWEPVT